MFEDDDFEDVFFASEKVLETEKFTDSENDFPYCPCEQDNDKEMIFCDGPNCEYEWWHYGCAGLTSDMIPEGSWICPECTKMNGKKKSNATRQIRSKSSTSTRKHKHKDPCANQVVPVKENSCHFSASPPNENDYRLTLKDALEMSLSIFKEATKKCMLSPSAQINKRVESHLSKIAQANDSQMDTISKKFVQECWSSVTAGDDKIPAAKGFEQICSHFHKAACKPNMEVLNLLTNLIGENDSSIGRIYQLLLHHTTTEILNKRFGPSTTDMTTMDSLNTVTLNKSEEQALRYACGYIPYSLTKHFRKFPKNEFAVATVSAMQKWHCNSEIESKNSKETDSATESSFMAYTKTWIDLINRGKLFEVSDETYRFFHAAEVVVKDYLNVKRLKKLSKVDSVKDELMKLLLKNRAVLLTWSVLTEKVNEQVADKLKERVLKKFVDMRCSSFCSVYLTCKKMSNPESVSSRGEKSLRVQLVGK